tara:strand:- start:24 stop:1043 length:1020 start_codon:yes stop_codon:yes gene_type:complete
MPTNEVRRELLNRAKASGYPGSITEVFQASDQGIDLIEQHQMQEQQQQMQVAQTPQEQETGLREQHAAGNTDASMAFPDVQPNQSFNTVGMEAPIDIQKIDDQGHLVESYKNVPPGIQDLPTGPSEGTIIESPAAYQKGGFNREKPMPMIESKPFQYPTKREELNTAIDRVVGLEKESDRPKVKKMLQATNFVENSMGNNPKAYNRSYTNSQASIDPIMFTDLFSPKIDDKGKSQGFTATQKKYFKRLEELGLPSDSTNFKEELQADNPLAATYAMRMVYAKSPESIPEVGDTAKAFKYYNKNYRKNNKVKDLTQSKSRFYEGYKMKFKKGGYKSKYCW